MITKADVMKPEQSAAAHSILNYYHGDTVQAIQNGINTAKDEDELKIVSDMLRGTVDHLVGNAHENLRQS
jgi:hypothetical protein